MAMWSKTVLNLSVKKLLRANRLAPTTAVSLLSTRGAPAAAPPPAASLTNTNTTTSRTFATTPQCQWGPSSYDDGVPQGIPEPGTAAGLDFSELKFAFMQTRCLLKYTWRDGEWDDGHMSSNFMLPVHAMSAGLHYGQGLFEGAKAHHMADGEVAMWNVVPNARRINDGAARLMMPHVPEHLFMEGMHRIVANNIEYVPPFGSGGALYIRPFMFGTGPQLGLAPAPEYNLCFVVTPVSPYYRDGLKAIDALVLDNFARAAPGGVGHVKAAGNYGADIYPCFQAQQLGYPTSLYLDPVENKYIEEFNVSNFIGISKDGSTFVTPDSYSVLPSITNKMLQQIAKSMGMKVEVRPVTIDECENFSEVAGCGTAVIIAPINSLTHGERVYQFDEPKVLAELYQRFRDIQVGKIADEHGWVIPVDLQCREEINVDEDIPLRLLTIHSGLGGVAV